MSKKSCILADYFGRLILKEMMGISFEVRAWVKIIKDVADAEYKKYWDDYTKRLPKQVMHPMPYGSMHFGGGYNMGNVYNFNDNIDPKGFSKRELTKNDLDNMDQDEIDIIIDTITNYHKLSYEKVMDLTTPKIVSLYNKAIKNTLLFEDVANTPIQKPTQVIIHGKDYPEAYAKFSVDKWVITDNNNSKTPTEYDHVNSGYKDNGEYTVYINCSLDNISSFVLTHEIKHAYQDWQRISKGKPSINQSKEIRQLYTKDFEKFVIGHARAGNNLNTLDSVIIAYYMSSNAEIAAYLEGVYDEITGGPTIQQFAGKLREVASNMENFKAVKVEPNTPPVTLQKKWKNITSEYDIPLFRKFKNVFDFLKYTERTFNKKGRQMIKKIDKLHTLKKQ